MAMGVIELILSVLVGLGVLVGLIVLGVVVAVQRQAPGMRGNLPQPAGPPTTIHKFGPADKPIAESARWEGTELVVSSQKSGSKALFDLPLPKSQECVLTYRFRIQTDNQQKAVYPELWCRIPEHGQFFSRGLDRKISGTHPWRDIELPFYVLGGQRADLLHLSLVCEGPAQVRLKDIEVLSAPLKPSA